jgi:hypothetical protein
MLGCSSAWECTTAEVHLKTHPWKPKPAKLVTLRCDADKSDAWLCDDVTLTTSKDSRVHLLCNQKEKAVFDVTGPGGSDGDK